MLGSSCLETKVRNSEPLICAGAGIKIFQDPALKVLSLQPSTIPQVKVADVSNEVSDSFDENQGCSMVYLPKSPCKQKKARRRAIEVKPILDNSAPSVPPASSTLSSATDIKAEPMLSENT